MFGILFLIGDRFGGSEASADASLVALKTPLGASVDPEVADSELRGRRGGVGGEGGVGEGRLYLFGDGGGAWQGEG